MSFDPRELNAEGLLREILLELQGLNAFLQKALEPTTVSVVSEPIVPSPAEEEPSLWRLQVPGLKPLTSEELSRIFDVRTQARLDHLDAITVVYYGLKVRDATEWNPA